MNTVPHVCAVCFKAPPVVIVLAASNCNLWTRIHPAFSGGAEAPIFSPGPLFFQRCFRWAGAEVGARRGDARIVQCQLERFDDEKCRKSPKAGYTSLLGAEPGQGNDGRVILLVTICFDPFDLGDKNQQGTIATK